MKLYIFPFLKIKLCLFFLKVEKAELVEIKCPFLGQTRIQGLDRGSVFSDSQGVCVCVNERGGGGTGLSYKCP